jgi:hypothetical protein
MQPAHAVLLLVQTASTLRTLLEIKQKRKRPVEMYIDKTKQGSLGRDEGKY